MRLFRQCGFAVVIFFTFHGVASAGLLPWITKWELEKHLGSRPYSDILQKAETANGKALASIKQPKILIDVPASAITPILAQQLKSALSQIKIGNGWTVTSGGDATFNFTTYAIAMTQPLKLDHSKWGTATFTLTVNGVPSLNGGNVVLNTALAKVQVDDFRPIHIALPGFMNSAVENAINAGLDSLNTLMPHPSFPLNLPAALTTAGMAQPAMLVTPSGVSVMLGPSGGTGAAPANYQNAFLAAAKKVFPRYTPGSGVLVAVDSTQDLTAATNQLVAQATAANLSTTLSLLKLVPGADPNTLNAASVANSVLVSASSDWLAAQLRQALIGGIAKFSDPKIKLTIPPANIAVKMIEGAAQASASGTATFLNGALSVQFSITAWAVVQPATGGMQIKYAIRDLKIESILVSWDGRQTGFQVPYQDQLGSLIARFIGTLPTTDVPIPNLPLDIKTSTGKTFTVAFAGKATNAVELSGRAILLSPQRTIMLVAPKLAGVAPTPPPAPLAPADGQYNQLDAVMTKAETLLNGGPAKQTAAVWAAKAALASLLQSVFTALNPYVVATLDYNKNYDLGQISAIPGDATCGNPCSGTSTCGNIGSCDKNVCSNVVSNVCETSCPGGHFNPLCRTLCHNVTKQVCHTETDNSCVNVINGCVDNVAKCTAAWTSGLQATCEAALPIIKANNLSGLAEISGNVTLKGSGQSFKNAQLAIAPDLGSANLSLVASGQATLNATANVTWTKAGNLFLCPSGQLSGQFVLSAPQQTNGLSATIAWSGGGNQALTAVISPQDATLALTTSPPPLQKLVTSNPGILACSLGQTIAGLAIVTFPKITQDAIASKLQQVLGGDNGDIAGAIVNGQYKLTQSISPITFEIPGARFSLFGASIQAQPAMTATALELATMQ
jgi:hypothetical protein